MSEPHISGICRICKCTDANPCVIQDGMLAEGTWVCTWLDEAHTLCSNLDCITVVPLSELCAIVFPYAAPRAKAAAR